MPKISPFPILLSSVFSLSCLSGYSIYCAIAPAYAEDHATQTEAKKKPLEDLPNFHEVHDYLLRGGAPTEKGLEELKEKGVSTIIDLRNPGEGAKEEAVKAKAMGFKYIGMPMNSQPPTKKQVDTFIKNVEEAQKADESGDKNKKVFVHCQHGSDRTGCMVGIWRVTHEGWPYDKTYAEMRKYYFTPKFTKLSGAVKEHATN